MPGCASPGGCQRTGPGIGMEYVDGRWRCHLCDHIAKLPQPKRVMFDLQKNDRADLKDSVPLPDLSAPRAAAAAQAFHKSSRQGPHRGNR